MVGTMTIITSFLSPYVVKFGWKVGDRFRDEPSEQKREEEEEPRKDDDQR
jgi:monovalent cation:H+ antiporter-2, CPA2 family